ncbi:hypothetical protein POVWA2_007610 [Plasmodium ovale wallikeri]|uniref:Uncharacterized protein n=1 Tax=Plasmodium ovale wallikeri TaxID=864142 RepID=A0A1A8YKI6_PLAOA|nr:hypothetical protein POVWA2_007610 [Plasmodium ovale wallikeri]
MIVMISRESQQTLLFHMCIILHAYMYIYVRKRACALSERTYFSSNKEVSFHQMLSNCKRKRFWSPSRYVSPVATNYDHKLGIKMSERCASPT